MAQQQPQPYVYQEYPKWVEKDGKRFIVQDEAEYLRHFPAVPEPHVEVPTVTIAAGTPAPDAPLVPDLQVAQPPHTDQAATPDLGAATGNQLLGGAESAPPAAAKPRKRAGGTPAP